MEQEEVWWSTVLLLLVCEKIPLSLEKVGGTVTLLFIGLVKCRWGFPEVSRRRLLAGSEMGSVEEAEDFLFLGTSIPTRRWIGTGT